MAGETNLRRGMLKLIVTALALVVGFVRPNWIHRPGSATLDEAQAAPAASNEEEHPAAQLGRRLLGEARWWFPGSLTLASAFVVAAVWIAMRYYQGYYESFGLTPSEAGVTRSDVLLRLLPWGALLALIVIVIRFSYIALRFLNPADRLEAPKHPRLTRFLLTCLPLSSRSQVLQRS